MRLKILLINPWIYDFAAYNLWARPLGLLKVAEYLSRFDTHLTFIDCMGDAAAGEYGTGKYAAAEVEKPEALKSIPRRYKRYGITPGEFTRRVKAAGPVDLVMITSVMSYWYPGVQETVELIRAVNGDIPVIVGGIYATLYPEHAIRHSGADFVHTGHVGDSLSTALYTFGFRLREKGGSLPYYRLGFYERSSFAPLLTSTGCPFSCSYCASALLNDKYRGNSPDSVLPEIGALYGLGVRDFAFYDDALLADAAGHIAPILEGIMRQGLNARFHTPNGLHACFIDRDLAALMKRAGFVTLRLSLETVDVERQKITGGKVDTTVFERAVINLKAQGFTKKELGVYLMYGLPGQGLPEVRDGIRFLQSLGVRINLTEFSPIRGTAAWQELLNSGGFDDSLDPLLTNNSVFSFLFSGYDADEVNEMKRMVKKYNGE